MDYIDVFTLQPKQQNGEIKPCIYVLIRILALEENFLLQFQMDVSVIFVTFTQMRLT